MRAHVTNRATDGRPKTRPVFELSFNSNEEARGVQTIMSSVGVDTDVRRGHGQVFVASARESSHWIRTAACIVLVVLVAVAVVVATMDSTS